MLLLERATLVQLRVWKGYRSVQCGWLDALAPGGGLRAVLAIHAPRRELVEMWAVPAGVRLRAIATGPPAAGCSRRLRRWRRRRREALRSGATSCSRRAR